MSVSIKCHFLFSEHFSIVLKHCHNVKATFTQNTINTITVLSLHQKFSFLNNFFYSFVLSGRPFVKWFALRYRTVVLSVFLSVWDAGVLWPNGWIDQDETWHGGRPWLWSQCVRWGPSSPSPLPEMGIAVSLFLAHVYCGRTVAYLSYCWALVPDDVQKMAKSC